MQLPQMRSLSRRLPAWGLAVAKNRMVHFLAMGAVLFSLAPPEPVEAIVVSDADIDGLVLAAGAASGSGEPGGPGSGAAVDLGPAPAAGGSGKERQEALDRLVEEELLFREALRLGADRGDPIVRQRLIQKMRFLYEDMIDAAHPAAEADLRDFQAAHAERYRKSDAVSFVHVYVRGGDEAARTRAAELRRDLSAQPSLDPLTVGDAFIVSRRQTRADRGVVAARFGDAFAEAVFALEPAEWSQPLRSKLGWHLVRVGSRLRGGTRPFAEVKSQLERDWRQARRDAGMRVRLGELARQHPIELHVSGGLRPSRLGLEVGPSAGDAERGSGEGQGRDGRGPG